MSTDKGRTTDERVIILVLAGIAFLCLVGIIAEDLAGVEGANDALLTIGSLSVGALASRISQKTGGDQYTTTDVVVKDVPRTDPLEDDFAVIGRAATKSIIAEAMRQMGASPSDHASTEPKE